MGIKEYSLIALFVIIYIVLNRILFYEPVFVSRRGRETLRQIRNEFWKQRMIQGNHYNLEVINNSIDEFSKQMWQPINFLFLWRYFKIKLVRDSFKDLKKEFKN